MSEPKSTSEELPADNGARLAIFDALHDAAPASGPELSREEFFDRVIGRLRVLVPQELHLLGEKQYVDSKIDVCVEAGIVQGGGLPGRLRVGDAAPFVRYPDGTLRTYTPGLEAARERLDRDDYRLRQAGFRIRQILKPSTKRRRPQSFRRLVASMSEHGFLDQFPLTESATAGIIDGLARQEAAIEAGVTLDPKRHVVALSKTRDTPLNHVLLVLDVNAERLQDEEIDAVKHAVTEVIHRSWAEVESDLELTRAWRRTEPKKLEASYDVKFEVDLYPYAGQTEAKVQVTKDRSRVMLRSLMREAGIAEYHRDQLTPFVATEAARTQHTGRKALFVEIDAAIDGIGKMRRDRKRKDLKVDPAWEEMESWLRSTFRAGGEDRGFG